MRILTAYSIFRKQDITFLDDCGCTTGGITEYEIASNGYDGPSQYKLYKIKCNNCGKQLTELPKVNKKEGTV